MNWIFLNYFKKRWFRRWKLKIHIYRVCLSIRMSQSSELKNQSTVSGLQTNCKQIIDLTAWPPTPSLCTVHGCYLIHVFTEENLCFFFEYKTFEWNKGRIKKSVVDQKQHIFTFIQFHYYNIKFFVIITAVFSVCSTTEEVHFHIWLGGKLLIKFLQIFKQIYTFEFCPIFCNMNV